MDKLSAGASPSSQRSIVIIDDSELALEIISSAFSSAGWKVNALSTPIGASVIVVREKPDVVLVDVSMASMRGDAVVRNIRSRQKEKLKIFLFSDRGEDELRELVAACGADGYLRKSSDPGGVVKQVESMMG